MLSLMASPSRAADQTRVLWDSSTCTAICSDHCDLVAVISLRLSPVISCLQADRVDFRRHGQRPGVQVEPATGVIRNWTSAATRCPEATTSRRGHRPRTARASASHGGACGRNRRRRSRSWTSAATRCRPATATGRRGRLRAAFTTALDPRR